MIKGWTDKKQCLTTLPQKGRTDNKCRLSWTDNKSVMQNTRMQKYRGYLVESFFYLNAVSIIRSYNSSYIIMRAI
jgi:hypothetical protein